MASFSDQHRQRLLDADADGIAALYHDDAEMLSFEFGTKQGRDAIRAQYADFFDFHGAISSVEPDRTVEHDGKLFTEFTMTSERGTFQLINAFVLDGDKATTHFSNVVQGEVEADEAEQ
jgi:ketosteroid isomerase-like protein